jgi:hypothetical protein
MMLGTRYATSIANYVRGRAYACHNKVPYWTQASLSLLVCLGTWGSAHPKAAAPDRQMRYDLLYFLASVMCFHVFSTSIVDYWLHLQLHGSDYSLCHLQPCRNQICVMLNPMSTIAYPAKASLRPPECYVQYNMFELLSCTPYASASLLLRHNVTTTHSQSATSPVS